MDLFILIIINLILMAVFFVVFFVYFRQKFQDHWDDQKYLQGLREEVNEMIKELNITTNRNVDLMEAKVQEVKEILGSAQLGTKALGAEIKKHQKSEEVYLQLGRKNLGRGASDGSKAPTQGNLFQPGKAEQNENPNPSELRPFPSSAKADNQTDAATNEDPKPGLGKSLAEGQEERLEPTVLKSRVTELYKKGISANLIAKNLGVTLGEVEFIIGLLG
jgi:hypothetical protein